MDLARRVLVLVHELDPLQPARRQPAIDPTDAGKQQHPPAAHPELAPLAEQPDDDIFAEQHQRHADDPLHHWVHARGQPLGEHETTTPMTKTTTAWPSTYSVE